MASLFKTISFVMVITGLSLVVFPAMAQLDSNVDNVAGSFHIAKGSDLKGTIFTIVDWFLGLIGLAAVIFIVYGGVQYIFSQGDESKAEQAKLTIIFAVIGLVVVGIAAVVVNFVLAGITQAS